MARHRNIRRLDFDEERDFDDIYGRSFDDEVAVSPATASQFMYPRHYQQDVSLSSYMRPHPQTTTKQKTLAAEGTVGEEREGKERTHQITTTISHLTKEDTLSTNNGSSVSKGPPPPKAKVSAGNIETVKVKQSLATPKMGFVMLQDSQSRGSSPARSPSPSLLPGRGTPTATPTTTPIRQPLLTRSASKGKPLIDVLSEYKKRQDTDKPLINLVVVGHVDAGKSTLMGHLLYQLGHVSKKTIHKYEAESQKLGKASFLYAWVLDETGEERNRGITMDIAQQQFETSHLIINLLDAPGHRDFIPNMITGAAQADVAILVVDATIGSFESGFESGGQTREHALLLRSLGVTQLIVAVNKMDTVEWSKERFDEILTKLKIFLKQSGYKESDVTYVPCSGMTGDNLTKPMIDSWYTPGPTLTQYIDKFRPPKRPVEKPFRCCISDIFKDIFKGQGSGINIAGKIESGYVQCNETVMIVPANEMVSVRGISINDASNNWAVAGDQVVLTLTGVDYSKLTVGSVLCSPDNPVTISSLVRGRIIIFNIDIPITVGYPVIFHYQSVSEPAIVKKLVSQINKTTGDVVKKKPRCLTKNTSAIVEIEFSRPVPVELYQDCKELGRFMLRYGGSTVAAGLIVKMY